MLIYFSAFCFLVPHDQSLRLYRVEANWALRHFSDALADLDYLCGFRPNWTEVRHVSCAVLAKHVSSHFLCRHTANTITLQHTVHSILPLSICLLN